MLSGLLGNTATLIVTRLNATDQGRQRREVALSAARRNAKEPVDSALGGQADDHQWPATRAALDWRPPRSWPDAMHKEAMHTPQDATIGHPRRVDPLPCAQLMPAPRSEFLDGTCPGSSQGPTFLRY